MATLQILDLSFLVRVQVGQQRLKRSFNKDLFFCADCFISFESSSYLLLCEAVAVKWGNGIYRMQLGIFYTKICVSGVSLKDHLDL